MPPTDPPLAADSSVAIAAFGEWHELHGPAIEAVSSKPTLVAHAALESYSVLTRLPEPFRTVPSLAIEYLRANFGTRRFSLPEDLQATAPELMQEVDVAGGAVYDGLVALSARCAGATLLTLDRRAARTYERLEIDFELIK